MVFIAFFEGAWELKRALMYHLRGKIYTTPESTPKGFFRVKGLSPIIIWQGILQSKSSVLIG